MGKSLNKYIQKMKIETPRTFEYHPSINNPKEKEKFIKRVEKSIRTSIEYRDYMNFLKDHVDMDKCVFFSKISNKDNKKFKIEIHHEPFTLYDYVSIVLEKTISEGEEINELLIADEVLELHYLNMVGLVPLSKTMHKLVHNSTKVFVPLNACYGQYSQFLEKYEQYIPEEIYDKLEQKINLSKNLTKESFEDILREFTYIEVNGFDEPEKINISKEELKIA